MQGTHWPSVTICLWPDSLGTTPGLFSNCITVLVVEGSPVWFLLAEKPERVVCYNGTAIGKPKWKLSGPWYSGDHSPKLGERWMLEGPGSMKTAPGTPSSAGKFHTPDSPRPTETNSGSRARQESGCTFVTRHMNGDVPGRAWLRTPPRWGSGGGCSLCFRVCG